MVDAHPADQAKQSALAHSFPPVFEPGARILILGSMPGQVSLQSSEYYAHPQNAFWPIVEALFGIATPLSYPQRIQLLNQQGIALWDVLRSCIRDGSLDSSIQASSIISNDFNKFYLAAPHIQAVFFNGATAEREYKKRVIPTLTKTPASFPTYRLPSTSPAMATLSRREKLKRWRLIVQTLNRHIR